MKKARWFTSAAVAAVVMVVMIVAAAPAFAASSDVTVGKFLIEIAKVKNLSARDAESALAALRGTGMRLPALNLGKRLTEGDVASIATAAGLNVTTSSPEAPFSEGQVDSFIMSFGSDLGKPPTDPPINPNDPPPDGGTTLPDPQPGKGKSKGHTKSPSEPM